MIGIDIKQVFNEDLEIYDLSIDSNGNLVGDDTFNTAVLVSLFTDSRADGSQVDKPNFRRGWAGNEQLENNKEFGSLLWLLNQRRARTKTLNDAESYAQNALQWFIERDYASEIEVNAYFNGDDLISEVKILKGDNIVLNKVYDIWKATELEYNA